MSKVEAGDVVLKDKEEEEEEDEDDLPNASTAAAPGQGAGDDLAELENETEQATEAVGALLNEIVQETDEKPQNASSDDSSPVIVGANADDAKKKETEVAKQAIVASKEISNVTQRDVAEVGNPTAKAPSAPATAASAGTTHKRVVIESSKEFWKAFDKNSGIIQLEDYDASRIQKFFVSMIEDTISNNTSHLPTSEEKKLVRELMDAIQLLCARSTEYKWNNDKCPEIRDSNRYGSGVRLIENDTPRRRRVNFQDAIYSTYELLYQLFKLKRDMDKKDQQAPVMTTDDINDLVGDINQFAQNVLDSDKWKNVPTPVVFTPTSTSFSAPAIPRFDVLAERKLPAITDRRAPIKQRIEFINDITEPPEVLLKYQPDLIASFVCDLILESVATASNETESDAVKELLRAIVEYDTEYSSSTPFVDENGKSRRVKTLDTGIEELGSILTAVGNLYNAQCCKLSYPSMPYTDGIAACAKKWLGSADHSSSTGFATSSAVIVDHTSSSKPSSLPSKRSVPRWQAVADLARDYPPKTISLKPGVPEGRVHPGVPSAFPVDRESFVPKKKVVGSTKAKTSTDEEAKAKHIRKIIDQARAMGYNMTDPTKWNVFPGCLSDGYKLTGVSYSDVLVKLHRNKRLCYLALTILKQEYGYRIPSCDYSAVIRAIERAQETERLEKEEEEAKQQAQEEEEEAERITKKKKVKKARERGLITRAATTVMNRIRTPQTVTSSSGPVKETEIKQREAKDSRLTTPPGNKDQVSLARSTTVDHLRQIRPPLETQKHPSKPVSHSTTWFKPT